MKKFILSGIILIALVGYVVYTRGSFDSDEPPIIIPSSTSPSAPVPHSAYKDGTYTGKVADAIYGKIQVQVLIQNGNITDLTYLQFPNSPGHTTQVSSITLPVLKQEAISAQVASVQIVSGATQTSEGFQQTLGDALSQAV